MKNGANGKPRDHTPAEVVYADALVGGAYVVARPADDEAARSIFDGAEFAGSAAEAERRPDDLYDLDAIFVAREGNAADLRAARRLQKSLGAGRVRGFRAVELPGWRTGALADWPRPNGLSTPGALAAWLGLLPDALGPVAGTNGTAHHNGGAGPEPVASIDYADMPDDDLGILDMDQVDPENVEFLWPDRYLKGELNLTCGEGGLGKSFLSLHRAALVSTGGLYPDGGGAAELGTAVILSAEDDPSRALAPRLIAMGADLSRIKCLKAQATIRRDGKPPMVHPVSLADLDYWNAVFDRFEDAKLFFCDGLPAYLGRGVNDHKNNEVRAALEPFITEVIRPRGIVFDAVSHLNKSINGATPSHRILGSVAYYNLARTVHVVFADADDPGRRLFGIIKSNYGPTDLPSLAFRIEPRTIEHKGRELRTAVPVFDAETVRINVAAAMRGEGNKRGPQPVKATGVAMWLVELLRDQPQPTPLADIFDEAGAGGFIGEQGKDGKWSNVGALYRGRDRVPRLEGDHAGWEIEETVAGEGGRGRKHWSLRRHQDTEGNVDDDKPVF